MFKLLLKYRPEDKAAKKERLQKKAQAESEGKTLESKKPIVVKYGINHITYLIEQVRNGSEFDRVVTICGRRPALQCIGLLLRAQDGDGAALGGALMQEPGKLVSR
jgi:hypothetical protein